MAYFLNLFTLDTWSKFMERGSAVTGFKHRQRRIAQEEIHVGDKLICYLIGASRWCGVLEIVSEAYEDSSPIYSDPDPFVIRFNVRPAVTLPAEQAVPIFQDHIWNHLSNTRGIEKGTQGWGAYYRTPLRKLADDDGRYLVSILEKQFQERALYPFTERDDRQITRAGKVRTLDRLVTVEVPEDEDEFLTDDTADLTPETEVRESIRVQARIARIGVQMGFRVWLPRNDRARVLEHVPNDMHDGFLESLPLNYDDTTLRTIEQIDVIWLKGRSMARAFEIEHTTAIYSGLLRMADLLALQPNMNIRLHIVAPDDKQAKVLREIRRPVFSLLERGPLYDHCTYLSYKSIGQIGDLKYLSHIGETIIDEFEEDASED